MVSSINLLALLLGGRTPHLHPDCPDTSKQNSFSFLMNIDGTDLFAVIVKDSLPTDDVN